MPTPFMHLQIAEMIRRRCDAEENDNGRLSQLLSDHWPAFYLGSVAPDLQIVSKARREETHFYGLPPAPENQGYTRMLSYYPQLADRRRLAPEQAVFVGAYQAHLLLDLIWFREILVPLFIEAEDIGDLPKRWLMHHTLLTVLDKDAYVSLPADGAETLSEADPQEWLPFAGDADIKEWRDLLVAQLLPGAPLQTATIYAGRLGMTVEQFRSRLDNEEWMSEVFATYVSLDRVREILATAVPASVELLHSYLLIDEK